MNKELDRYLEERRKDIENIRKENLAKEPTSEELTTEDNVRSLKSITNKLENFFSEEHMLQIADDEKKETAYAYHRSRSYSCLLCSIRLRKV